MRNRDEAFGRSGVSHWAVLMPKRLMIWTQALILALAACPLPAGLLAVALTSAAGCRLGENSPIPCVVFGHDFGGLLYGMASSIRFVALTIPLAVLAVIVWRIVLYFKSARRIEINDRQDAVRKFPGPLTIGPPLKGHRLRLFGAAFLTIVCSAFDTTTIPAATFFGVVTMMIVVKLVPGSHTLRLDVGGFEITRWFRTRRFLWSEVSDFAAYNAIVWRFVAFKERQRHLGIFDKISAPLMNGRNRLMPNCYGAQPNELARLMTSWRSSALPGTEQTERARTSTRTPLKQPRARRRLLSY
jgi:hypothetical protein